MTVSERFRGRAARLWRALWPVVVVAGGAITCDAPSGPGRGHGAQISVVPDFSSLHLGRFAGLTVDQVRLLAIRPGPPPETLTTQTFAFPADSSAITINLSVDVEGTEQILVVFDLLAGSQVMFSGSQLVTAEEGRTTQPPAPIVPSFVGPGSNVGSLHVTPRDSGTALGGSFPLNVTALDSSNNPVAAFYASWSTNATAASGHTINGAGVFKAGNSRGRVWVYAATPTGIKDSTTVSVTPVATSIGVASGSGQSGAAGVPLAQPLVARVVAADGLPVVGVPVTFTVISGGGAVFPQTVSTDTLGLAATTATLGPQGSGTQTFHATTPGVGPAAVFSASITSQPQISLTLLDGGVVIGVGSVSDLVVSLSQPAPSGGVNVNLHSDSTAYLLFGQSPDLIVPFPQGRTRDTVQVNGVATGVARVRATAIGHDTTVTFFAVTPNFIILNPASLNVAVSGTASLGVQLSTPAPAGGLAVALSSQNTAIATVTTTVSIAAGQTNGTATVSGVAAGQTAILAAAPGYGQGGAMVTVGGSGTPASITRTAGDGLTAYLNDTTAVRPQVQVLDGAGAPVSGVVVNFVITGGGGSMPVTSAVTNAGGFATAGAAWRMGSTAGANQLTAQLPSFPSILTIFTATAQNPPPVIQLNVFGSNVVGVGRTGQLDVTLLQPAPAGGVTVTVTSDSTQYLTVAAPGTIAFAPGETQKSIIVNGIAQTPALPNQGARLRADAPGYTADTLFVPVSVNLISLPGSLNVPLDQTVSLGITLSTPAPAGGVQVAVSSNSANAVVTTPTVTIAQGGTVGSASIRGDALGSATITATNPNYAPFQTAATVTASLNITATTLSLNASFGAPLVVQLESGGLPVNAPAGGVNVSLTPRNTACVSAPNTSIPGGFVSAGVLITYGGTATLPCSTYVVASGPAGFGIDSVQANVAVPPTLSSATVNIGSGLQRNTSVTLGASNHGGTTVHLVSNAPGSVLLAPDQVTPGTASIDVPVGINGTAASFYYQGVEGRTADTVTFTASAPGFTTATWTVRVWQPVIDLQGLATSATPLDANRGTYVRIGTPVSPTGGINTLDEIRAGGSPVVAHIALSDSTVARLIGQTAGRADTATTTIAVLASNSPTTFAAGGVDFDVVGTGSVTTTASSPVARAVGSAQGVTTVVSAPNISLPTINIGSGLQRNTSGSLGASQHGGVTVHLVSADPAEALLSPDAVTPGTATLDIVVPNGNATFSYYVQGVEGRIADTSIVTATAPGFATATAPIRVWQAVIDMQGVPTGATSLDANRAVYVRIGTPTTPTGGINTLDEIRAGGAAVTATIALSDSTVARLIGQTAGRADTATVTIAVGQSNSPTTFAAGGAEFDVVAAGTVTTTAATPVTRSVGTATGVTTVISAPSISVAFINIGSGLQRQTSGSLGASQHGGVTVHLVSADPAEALLAPNLTTAGTATLDVFVPNGQTSFSYVVQGMEGRIADTSVITATAPGFTNGTGSIRVWQAVYDLQGYVTNPGTLDADRPIYTRIGTPTSPTGGINTLDEIRAGGTALTATFKTTTATVAQLVTSSTTPGSQQTAPIPVGQSNSPTTVASGGVGIDYLTSGQTTITVDIPGLRALSSDTALITVSAPTISVSAVTVGSGLQENSGAGLSSGNHNGVDVTISSSNPSVALVAPNATTPGQPSITVHLNNGFTSATYYVQGVEGIATATQVTIRVQAPGFTDGTATATVVKPAMDISGLATSGSAASTADDQFVVRVGLPNAQLTGLNVLQEVRAGAPGPLAVTLTSTAPSVGLLKLFGQGTGTSSIGVSIPSGQTQSPTGNVTGAAFFEFLSQGITFVVPTATNFLSLQQSVTGTDGFRVTVNP